MTGPKLEAVAFWVCWVSHHTPPFTGPQHVVSHAPMILGRQGDNHNATHDFELLSLAPVFQNGWSLLGELNKVTRVAAARVPWLAATTGGIAFGVLGQGAEEVVMTVLVPTGGNKGLLDGTIRSVSITMPPGGALNVTCSSGGCTF